MMPPKRMGAACLALIVLSSTACIDIPTLDDLVLRPSATIKETPADLGFEYEALEIPVPDAETVSAWYIPSQASKALVTVIPGSDANKGRYVVALPLLVPAGYDVLLMDYQGFGETPGEKSLATCMKDSRAVAEYALGRHSRVVLFGVSLGTPQVARLASEYSLTGCIFEGTAILRELPRLWLLDRGIDVPFFWNVADLYMAPQIPAEYDILTSIAQAEEPKLFMHSVEDETTPIAGGYKVFNAAPEPKEFWEMQGQHGHMIDVDPEAYRTRIVGWLDSVVQP